MDIDRVEKYANIKIIAKQVCDHVQWFNDLVSYQKEKSEYEKSNDGKLFCKRLAFNKVALLTRKFVKQHDDSTIENDIITASDEIWKEMEQKAFQQLHADINQKHGFLNGEIKDLIKTIEEDQNNPSLNNQKIIYLKDLHGWLNGQVPWAAFADRYALSGSISQAVANNRLHNLMFPEQNS